MKETDVKEVTKSSCNRKERGHRPFPNFDHFTFKSRLILLTNFFLFANFYPLCCGGVRGEGRNHSCSWMSTLQLLLQLQQKVIDLATWCDTFCNYIFN